MTTNGATFRERLLVHLEDRGVNEGAIADQLKDAIQGVRRKKTYDVNRESGNLVLTRVEEVTTPKDQAAGALLFDALTGGSLGLTPKQLSGVAATAEMYKRFAPTVDRRVIATVEDFSEEPLVGQALSVELELKSESESESESESKLELESESESESEFEDGQF